MNVRDIMNKEVTFVSAAQPIADVAHVMRQLDIGSLPVVQDGRLVGIVTLQNVLHSMTMLAESRRLRRAAE